VIGEEEVEERHGVLVLLDHLFTFLTSLCAGI
jgi:hypothetical protein